MPLLVPLCSHSGNNCTRGHVPPRPVVAISTRQGGPAPSLSCSRFLYDTTRRGLALLAVFFPFRRDEPLMFFPFL